MALSTKRDLKFLKKSDTSDDQNTSSTAEFDVEMTCENCVDKVKKALAGVNGIVSVNIDLGSKKVVVESTLNSSSLLKLIEKSGKRAVLKGIGGTTAKAPAHLGAAVSMMQIGEPSVNGLIRFVQTDEQKCVIEGTVDGLPPGHHAICVHECGDISDGCNSCGDLFNQDSTGRPAGEMGDILAGPNGRAEFRFVNERLKVWDLIGRSMMIHNCASELAHARKNSNDKRLTCGIIARSSGLFQNPKTLCACDGVTQWDERNVPLAGPGRQAKM